MGQYHDMARGTPRKGAGDELRFTCSRGSMDNEDWIQVVKVANFSWASGTAVTNTKRA